MHALMEFEEKQRAEALSFITSSYARTQFLSDLHMGDVGSHELESLRC